MTLAALNGAPEEPARQALLACCGSEAWVARLLASRPFNDEAALHSRAQALWFSLTPADWLEAFSKHPKIGEKSSSKWSAEEQSGMAQVNQEMTDAMRRLNVEYERRFGWIFIVCATGKRAEEMRNLLEQRLSNDPATELQTAAREQAAIMRLRLDKLLAE